MIALAGGIDVFGEPGGHSARLTWSQVAAADPDVIVAMPCGFDEAGAREQIATISGRPEWRALRAAREGKVFPVDANGCFSRPGPRLVDGVERLAAILHGGNPPASSV
jgi:iron complex transport system substrate-binding protein